MKSLGEELKKCKEDPIYFISNYIKVIHPARGMVKFDLYPFQKTIVNDLMEHRFNILRKFRQAGCTTIAAAFSLWFVYFHSHKSVAILSKGDQEATEVLDRVKIMYEELPQFMKSLVKIKTDNKHNFRLTNGSYIKSRASGRQSGRSLSASLLILDEAAFIENISTIWAAAYPTIGSSGRVFVLSTVNGIGNWYHEQWVNAEAGLSNFNPILINWEDHPEYHRHEGYEWLYEEMEKRDPPVYIDRWEKTTKSNISHKDWLQEYECSFLGTGDTYIHGDILKYLRDNATKDYRTEESGKLRIFEEPSNIYEYAIGVDVGLGRGHDYSAFHVINLWNGNQVAEYYSNTTPINEFGKVIDRVGREYNLAYTLVERNAIGHNLINVLVDSLEYENVMIDERGDWGIQTTLKSKEQFLADMEEFIRTFQIKIKSERTVNELMTFIINENNKIEADVGQNDDLVMSLAIAVRAIKMIQEHGIIDFDQFSKESTEPPKIDISRYNSYNYKGMSEEDLKWLMKD